ncbi:TIM barrel protein, partial [Pseudomonas sp.]|uniref:TIM barrel protein n=1 Tax=Pseudomonas sp. TaxID=306 RepID=UPI004053FA9E
MKIAANLSLLFSELPLIDRVVAAAAAGFDGVEIQFPYELPAVRLKEALQAADMPLRLINLPASDLMSGGPGLAAVPARQTEFDAALQQALSYAAMVRPALVNVLPGRLADGVEPEQALACLVDNLHKTAEAFQLLGIGVVVEAINPLDMP